MGQKITALIVDDEPLARKYIRRMLDDHRSIEVVGECGNGKDAVETVLEKKPDLVFLDIQMPEMDGFTVIETLGIENLPNIVFVTAYEQYAIRAFEIHALDYLLKPFDQPRFETTVKRALETIGDRQRRSTEQEQLAALLENVRQKPHFLDRLAIKVDGRIIFLQADEIDWIQADDKYVHLHTGNRSHLIRHTLSWMEAQLDPEKFVRVHRSSIVNIERIKELHPMFTGEHTIVLDSGVTLTLSRNYKSKLFDVLGNPM